MAKKTVLVVDDEFSIRELVELSLEPDFEVVKAENGEEALVLAKRIPDLIILDIMMPKVDGFEVCRKLKKDPETKGIPIIMLTAKHTVDDLKKAISNNVDEFITKPFEPDILKKRVEFYTDEEKRSSRGKLFQYGKSIHYIKERDMSNEEE